MKKLYNYYLFICLFFVFNTGMAQTNKYQILGEQLLDSINNKFYDGSQFYKESIQSNGTQNPAQSFLWPAVHLVRALTWGAQVNPKYKDRLQSYVTALESYKNGA